jgi:hypothetical protein
MFENTMGKLAQLGEQMLSYRGPHEHGTDADARRTQMAAAMARLRRKRGTASASGNWVNGPMQSF